MEAHCYDIGSLLPILAECELVWINGELFDYDAKMNSRLEDYLALCHNTDMQCVGYAFSSHCTLDRDCVNEYATNKAILGVTSSSYKPKQVNQ